MKNYIIIVMVSNKIQIYINGKKKILKKNHNLLELLKNLKLRTNGIAVEINLTVIPKSQYKNTLIKNNDKVEIVQFIGGG